MRRPVGSLKQLLVLIVCGLALTFGARTSFAAYPWVDDAVDAYLIGAGYAAGPISSYVTLSAYGPWLVNAEHSDSILAAWDRLSESAVLRPDADETSFITLDGLSSAASSVFAAPVGTGHTIPEPSTLILLMTAAGASLLQFVRKNYHALSRFFDVTIASIALVLTAPILLIAAILIKIDSPGPVFYKQVRVGVNRRSRERRHSGRAAADRDHRRDNTLGAPFTIYKLRSMRFDAERGTGAVWAQQNDARVTRIGKLIRLTRVDEIPQFINVLRGDMSFIGPRPERPEFVKKLNAAIPYYYRRFDIPPGITGLAQTRAAYAADIKQTRRKLKYDLMYVRKKCLLMDTRIFFNTISTVVLGRGAR